MILLIFWNFRTPQKPKFCKGNTSYSDIPGPADCRFSEISMIFMFSVISDFELCDFLIFDDFTDFWNFRIPQKPYCSIGNTSYSDIPGPADCRFSEFSMISMFSVISDFDLCDFLIFCDFTGFAVISVTLRNHAVAKVLARFLT